MSRTHGLALFRTLDRESSSRSDGTVALEIREGCAETRKRHGERRVETS